MEQSDYISYIQGRSPPSKKWSGWSISDILKYPNLTGGYGPDIKSRKEEWLVEFIHK